ncbi:MAG: TetR/AcrR family transcriptional regulator [Mycolicibacterium sp.]|nr:TetR/AcrR family transcriptional regulator [Mycolicibacterium sp.]
MPVSGAFNRQVVQGVRTGGRSARVREAVLSAVLNELNVNGYATLSVEAVASRAGVNKTTIYRRWPTLDDLLVDALTTWSQDAIPGADTGSIETDLLTLGRELADQLNGGVGRQIVAVVLTAGLRSARLREATRRYFDQQAVRATPVVARAIARGELPANTDTNVLLTTFRAPLFYRMVTTGDPIDDGLIAQTTRVTLAAARAGLLSM